jgi:hypothetical protein
MVYGKILVLFPDCKNEKLLMSEFVRNISSGDLVPIERKGVDAFSAELNARLIVASNSAPDLTSGNADLSRLIYLKVAPSLVKDDPTFEQRLIDEYPHFVAHCLADYQELAPKHGLIALPSALDAQAEDLAADFEQEFELVFSKTFDSCSRFDHPDGKPCQMPQAVFYELCMENLGRDNLRIKSFKDWITRKGLGEFTRDSTKARNRVCLGLTQWMRHTHIKGFSPKHDDKG